MSSVSTVSTTATGGLGGESREPWRWLQWARKPHNNQTQVLFLSSCLLISCVCQRSLMLKFKRIIVFLISSWFELLKILRILHNWTNRGTLQRSALLISSLYLNQLFCFQSQVAEGGSARSSFSGWIDETGLAVYTYPCIV